MNKFINKITIVVALLISCSLLLVLISNIGSCSSKYKDNNNLSTKDFLIFDRSGKKVLSLYIGKSDNVIIPDDIDIIGEGCFKNCWWIKNIKIPNSVKEIGEEAFYGCSELVQIYIPGSITKIRTKAFWYCKQLSFVTLGDGVKEICSFSFSSCGNLEKINIPSSVELIESFAFEDCISLKNVIFSNTYDWCYSGKISLLSSDLKQPDIAAEYLTDKYLRGKWRVEKQ